MSTTPDPSPLDPTPLDPTPLDPTPLDPTLDGVGAEPTRLDAPFGAETDPGLLGTPAPDDVPGDVPLTGDQPRAADTSAAIRQSDLKAFYAAAGATEVLVGALRGTLAETSRWANARLAELRFRRAELAKQADEMRLRADGLPEDVKAVPEVAKARAADLQEQAASTYTDLAGRGQRVLQGVRTDVASRIDPAFDKLQERVDAARRAIRGAAAPTTASGPVPAAEDLPTDVLPPEGVPFDDVVVEEIVVDEVVVDPTGPRDEDYPRER